jgi:hypothetical protein
VAAHSEDPVGAELEALLEQPEIRQRLDESKRRFEAGETRPTPHKDVRRRLGLSEVPSEEPSSVGGALLAGTTPGNLLSPWQG